MADRLSSHPAAFAGEPWWEYAPGLLIQAMPWTPLAVVGAWHSLRRAVSGPGHDARHDVPAAVVAGDRLLWAWSAAPIALLTMATVKNAHYAIAAQVPWSIWAALGLSRLARPPRPPRLVAGPACDAPRSPASRRWGWPTAWASGCSAPGSTAAASSGPSTSRPAG